jgi:rare lipoprotein A
MRRCNTFAVLAIGAILLGGCSAIPAPPPDDPTHEIMDADEIIRSSVRARVPASATRPVALTAPRPTPPRPKPAPVARPEPKPLPELWTGDGKCEGIASWYGGKFIGRRTANGERYTGKSLTAAHRVLKFGTRVRVTNLKNGLDVVVRINDRGPFIAGRVIDLSPAAARELAMVRDGVVRVRLEVEN